MPLNTGQATVIEIPCPTDAAGAAREDLDRAVVVIVNIPIVVGLGWLFFSDLPGFLKCLLYSLQWIVSPIIVSDEEHSGTFEPIRLGAFLFSGAAIGYVEYLLLAWLGLAV